MNRREQKLLKKLEHSHVRDDGTVIMVIKGRVKPEELVEIERLMMLRIKK